MVEICQQLQLLLACMFIVSEESVEAFEDARVGGVQVPEKQFVEFREPSVHKSGGSLFFIGSESDVFILNDGGDYSRQLTSEEVSALEFSIVWIGPAQKVRFEADDLKAVDAILTIITNLNVMQPEMFQAWTIASLISHFRAFLFELILESQTTFYTSVVLSGEQRGTGRIKDTYNTTWCYNINHSNQNIVRTQPKVNLN